MCCVFRLRSRLRDAGEVFRPPALVRFLWLFVREQLDLGLTHANSHGAERTSSQKDETLFDVFDDCH